MVRCTHFRTKFLRSLWHCEPSQECLIDHEIARQTPPKQKMVAQSSAPKEEVPLPSQAGCGGWMGRTYDNLKHTYNISHQFIAMKSRHVSYMVMRRIIMSRSIASSTDFIPRLHPNASWWTTCRPSPAPGQRSPCRPSRCKPRGRRPRAVLDPSDMADFIRKPGDFTIKTYGFSGFNGRFLHFTIFEA